MIIAVFKNLQCFRKMSRFKGWNRTYLKCKRFSLFARRFLSTCLIPAFFHACISHFHVNEAQWTSLISRDGPKVFLWVVTWRCNSRKLKYTPRPHAQRKEPEWERYLISNHPLLPDSPVILVLQVSRLS